jgi:hypothetical protein
MQSRMVVLPRAGVAPSAPGHVLEHVLVGLAFIAHATRLGDYGSTLAFKDHVEPSIGAIARALLEGQAPYHGVTGEASYELPYGPALYALHALTFAALGPSPLTLKLPGIVANVAALAFVFAALRHRVGGRCAAGVTLLALAYLAFYDVRAYWCRPEPFLLLGSALSLWVARTRPPGAVVAIGVVVAVMIDLKATGFLYVVPIFALVARRDGLGVGLLAALGGAALALVPFAAPPIHLRPYMALLERASSLGLSLDELAANARAVALLAAPTLLALGLKAAWPVSEFEALPRAPGARGAGGALPVVPALLCVAIVCVVAAKPGAGRHHLVPFVPLAADMFAGAIARIECSRVGENVARAGALLVRAAMCAAVLHMAASSARDLAPHARRARAASAELDAMIARVGPNDWQMGYGDAASYEDTFERAFATPPARLVLDAASQMDSAAVGFSASRLLAKDLAAGEPPVWILPRGAPFSIDSYYAGGPPVFDAQFRARFAELYAPVYAGQFYAIFQRRGLELDVR